MEKRGQAGDTVGSQGTTGTIDFHELVGVDNVKPCVNQVIQIGKSAKTQTLQV